jgi:hypothetical protein
MKNGFKGKSQLDVDKRIADSIDIFKLITERATFLKTYSKLLEERLLNESCLDENIE